MKKLPALIIFCLTSTLGPVAKAQQGGEDFSPSPVEVEHYRSIWERSPFVLPAKAATGNAGLAQRFALTGVAVVADDPIIFLLDRKNLARVMVRSNDKESEIKLVSIENASDMKLASATIRVGNEQAVVRYDPASLQAPNTPQPNAQAAAGAPNGNPPLAQASGPEPQPAAARTLKRRIIKLAN